MSQGLCEVWVSHGLSHGASPSLHSFYMATAAIAPLVLAIISTHAQPRDQV
jgi:hypothetical protein